MNEINKKIKEYFKVQDKLVKVEDMYYGMGESDIILLSAVNDIEYHDYHVYLLVNKHNQINKDGTKVKQ